LLGDLVWSDLRKASSNVDKVKQDEEEAANMSDDPKKIVAGDAEAGNGYTGDIAAKHEHDHRGLASRVRNSISVSSVDEETKEGQIFSMHDIDPALDAKMRLVNNVSDHNSSLRRPTSLRGACANWVGATLGN
jgi:hypothetical protein